MDPYWHFIKMTLTINRGLGDSKKLLKGHKMLEEEEEKPESNETRKIICFHKDHPEKSIEEMKSCFCTELEMTVEKITVEKLKESVVGEPVMKVLHANCDDAIFGYLEWFKSLVKDCDDELLALLGSDKIGFAIGPRGEENELGVHLFSYQKYDPKRLLRGVKSCGGLRTDVTLLKK